MPQIPKRQSKRVMRKVVHTPAHATVHTPVQAPVQAPMHTSVNATHTLVTAASQTQTMLSWTSQQIRRYSFLVAKAFCVVCNPYVWFTPTVLSETKTVALLAKGKSIGRFGDGEIALMMGTNLYFQRYSDALASELVHVLNSDDEAFLVGIPTVYGTDKLRLNTKLVDMRLWQRFEKYSKLILPKSKIFASAFITRPILNNAPVPKKYFEQFRAIWSGKTIVYVHHDARELSHALFANAKKRVMVVCPKVNAYDQVDMLMTACMAAPKDAIYLLAAGPTATVLAYRLAKQGRQAIDLGHLTLEYDANVRGVSPKELTRYK